MTETTGSTTPSCSLIACQVVPQINAQVAIAAISSELRLPCWRTPSEAQAWRRDRVPQRPHLRRSQTLFKAVAKVTANVIDDLGDLRVAQHRIVGGGITPLG